MKISRKSNQKRKTYAQAGRSLYWLRAVCLELLLGAWISNEYETSDWTTFGVSKLNMRLHRLVWVYTCQNTTLFEITCRGSFVQFVIVLQTAHLQWLPFYTQLDELLPHLSQRLKVSYCFHWLSAVCRSSSTLELLQRTSPTPLAWFWPNLKKSSCLKVKPPGIDPDIWYVASSSRPLPSLFKLCSWGQNGPSLGWHVLHRLI